MQQAGAASGGNSTCIGNALELGQCQCLPSSFGFASPSHLQVIHGGLFLFLLFAIIQAIRYSVMFHFTDSYGVKWNVKIAFLVVENA